MSKSTRGSLAWGERFDNFKLGLNDRDQNKLCQALTNGNLERFMASVPAGDLDLTLVVRINQTHQVAEYDPVLMPKTRAREDHCGQCGIFNMQGQSCGNELRLPGIQRQGRIKASPKVKPCRAWRCVLWQWDALSKSWVKNLELNVLHGNGLK